MTRNRTQDTLDSRLLNRITALEKTVLALSTPQPIGGDILTIISAPDGFPALFGPFTLAAGQAGNVSVEFDPSNSTLTLWNFATSLTVDGTDFDDRVPNGANLSGGQRASRFSSWLDYLTSDDSFNSRTLIVQFENVDSVSHQYYVYIKAYVPKISLD